MAAGRSWRNISNVVRKEWLNALRTPNSVLFMTLFPILITVQVLFVIWLVVSIAGPEALSTTIFHEGVQKLARITPAVTSLSPVDRFKLFFYSLMPLYILLIPAMVANGLATFSIIEEKQTGTLEPLLATPVKTWELLIAKALYGAIPAVLVTWICAVLFLAGVAIIGPVSLLHLVVSLEFVLSLILVVPLVTLLSFLVGVIGSSRARDAKGAQNLAILIVLPLFGIVAIQLLGILVFKPIMIILLSVAILLIDILVLRLAVRLFHRESIITKWK